ncbi:HEAT repeat domain-containing protein [Aphanothece sacrum]|uniref:PBS lyase HEAT domain protein repeat-containing protein n=1 Tax=Aphanothece sacrum FPU1 TaxID=1920663 RepID=A0A401IIA9_APHSA|nr:HEAT repeat domain-containing protein [Aphanothece sacrum]GBF81055.1 PBS lyase HEAT domain protein repeat-containing protein [Aphanothece sacrum FPU1]GBF85456.1 PBS lyase [Aphanothece sacrum FPU3]
MDKRFFSFFNLTEAQAIAILDTPQAQITENDSRYIAASHLINFPTEQAIEALIRAVQEDDPILDNRIVRRKSIETLGRLQAVQALPVIYTCLADTDCYTVENAVWAIGEIGTNNGDVLEEVAKLLEKPGQTYRVIIHTLTKLNYQPAIERIRKFVDDADAPTASAAISAICRLTGDYSQMDKVVAMLQHPKVLGRRLSIQDLIDAHYYDAIPHIARCPVSLVFRLRGIRMLAEVGIPAGAITFATIQPHLEQTLRDHPDSLDLVHSYEDIPDLSFLVRELYETDFGRCYLATKTILDHYSESAPAALFATYEEEARNDYGAHFHVMKLFGWLKHSPAYDLLIEALHNKQPQFQKSRAAAAIALGELGDKRAIGDLKASLETKIWDLKYAALMALEKLGDDSKIEIVTTDEDWLYSARLKSSRLG